MTVNKRKQMPQKTGRKTEKKHVKKGDANNANERTELSDR